MDLQGIVGWAKACLEDGPLNYSRFAEVYSTKAGVVARTAKSHIARLRGAIEAGRVADIAYLEQPHQVVHGLVVDPRFRKLREEAAPQRQRASPWLSGLRPRRVKGLVVGFVFVLLALGIFATVVEDRVTASLSMLVAMVITFIYRYRRELLSTVREVIRGP